MTTIFSYAPFAPLQGFWRRQFAPVSTHAQDRFDVIFAVVLPIFCLIADPLVFKGGILNVPLLQDYQFLAYLVSSIEIGLFLTWRTFRTQVSTFSAPFAGVFFAGALFSVGIGIAIIPFTLLGLVFLIGFLGLTPFFTGLVYFRNGLRAMKAQARNATHEFRFLAAVLGALLMLGLPILASVHLNKSVSASVDTVIYGNIGEAQAAAAHLGWFRFIPVKHTNQLIFAYMREDEPSKREILKQTYKDVTGRDIEKDQYRFFD